MPGRRRHRAARRARPRRPPGAPTRRPRRGGRRSPAAHLVNAAALVGGGPAPRRRGQAPAAQLLGLRRAALVPAGRGAVRTFALAGGVRRRRVCEDLWVPRRAGARARRGGLRAPRRPQRLALLRGRGAERLACCGAARPRRAARSPTSTSWAARTSWSSTARASSSRPTGDVLAAAPQFEEALLVVDVDVPDDAGDAERLRERVRPAAAARRSRERRGPPVLDGLAEVYAALVTGTHDYLAKNGFAPR